MDPEAWLKMWANPFGVGSPLCGPKGPPIKQGPPSVRQPQRNTTPNLTRVWRRACPRPAARRKAGTPCLRPRTKPRRPSESYHGLKPCELRGVRGLAGRRNTSSKPRWDGNTLMAGPETNCNSHDNRIPQSKNGQI